MDKHYGILAINVGSISTKLAWFKGSEPVASETIQYRKADEDLYSCLEALLPSREGDVLAFLERNGIQFGEIDLVVSRGGLGRPAPGGAYTVDESMCRDLLEGRYGKHSSALGPAIALSLSKRCGSQAVVIDPPSTDEFHPLARISGIPEIERKSAFHSLNQKMVARRHAARMGVTYRQINLVVAHMGGGITIGAHREGRVIDCTHGLSEGPFTPERAGSLPTSDLLDLAFSGRFDRKALQKRLVGEGGIYAYLRTVDMRKVEEMIVAGNEKAKLILDAMAYQIAKEIGSMCVVLKGTADGIILTGGMAHSVALTEAIKEWVGFLAPVFVYPGEDEMTALAQGGLRVLMKEEEVSSYELAEHCR